MDLRHWANRKTRRIQCLGIGWMVLCFLLLTSCGGGGGGGGGPINPGGTDTLEGVAAGGAPLVGTVTVRDADGETLIETVALNGTFTFDVTGMTPPFVVWAEGAVKGAPATYYATCDSDGRVNVTPLTHLAMALALGQDPADYYQANPNAGPPSTDAMQEATETLGTLLAGMYGELGLPADFDLMRDEFDADGTGFDRLLEMITVTVDGSACCLAEKASGQELLIDDDMADDNGPEVVPTDQAQAMTTGMAAAREYFALLNSAYEDGTLNNAEQRQISARLATGLIDRGRTLDQTLAAIAGGGTLAPGMQFEVLGFHRLMHGATDHPLGDLGGVSERGSHAMGFWCGLEYRYNGCIVKRLQGFVLESGQWKNFGNRIPMDKSLLVLPLASHFVYYNGASVQTGLALSIDDIGLRAQALGVRKVLIANDALPEMANPFGAGTIHGVVMAPDNIDLSGSVFRVVEPAGLAGRTHYANTDDPGLIAKLAANSEFLYVALDASDQPIFTWASVLFEQPYPIPRLYKYLDSYFPKMTTFGGAPARPIIPPDQLAVGPILTWTNLADPTNHTSTVRAEWWNDALKLRTEEIYNPAYGNYSEEFEDWTSEAFSPPPGDWTGAKGRLSLSSLNRNGHAFSKGMEYSVGVPAPVAFAASLPFVSHRTLADGTQLYYGFVGLTDNGQPVEPARISDVSINPDEGDPTPIDTLVIDQQNYYLITCTNTTGHAYPPSDAPNGTFTGVNFTLPAGASFDSDMYTIRAHVDGTPVERACPIMAPGGGLTMPVITGLQALWGAGGELNLSWQPPAVTTNIHQMIMWFSSAKPEGGYRVVLRVNLSGAALSLSQLTIPADLAANIRILKDTGAVAWNIDTRYYYPIGSEYFEIAGSRSETVTISGW